MTLFASLHCQHQVAIALRPSYVSFLGFDWPMAGDHVLRKPTGWELCAKVLLKPSNLQRQSIPRTKINHLGEDPEVIVEVRLAGLLLLNTLDGL